MSANVRVALDAMGGDHAPGETVLGAVEAAREYGVGVCLVGKEELIKAELAKYETQGLDLPIIHTDEVIPMDEHDPARAARNKNTSMVRALQLVRDGEFPAAGSACNSGAMIATSIITLTRLPGEERPALVGIFPTRDGICLVID